MPAFTRDPLILSLLSVIFGIESLGLLVVIARLWDYNGKQAKEIEGLITTIKQLTSKSSKTTSYNDDDFSI